MPDVLHAVSSPVVPTDVEALLAWAGAGDDADRREDVDRLLGLCGSPTDGEPLWLLAHCDDGVTWGKDDGRALALSHGLFAAHWDTPRPGRENVQQLRVFGARGELLLWRTEDAPRSVAGRALVDGGGAAPEDETGPLDQEYLLAATQVAGSGETAAAGFTAVSERSGRTQVVPLRITEPEFDGGRYMLALRVRHYFACDEVTGALRIAATRLVSVGRTSQKSFIERDIPT